MDTRHITPVSGRTRSQMKLSYRKESCQSSRKGPKNLSRTPEASGGPNSDPKIERKLIPNAVGEVEFLLVDPDGNVRKKFYFDEMKICLDSEDKGKETVEEGTTSKQPIILSDEDEDDDDDGDDEQVEPKEDSSANNKQGSKESMPLKKRQKFDEQQLPGLPNNSSLKGDKLIKDMKGDKPIKDMKGDKPIKDMEGDKLFKHKLFKDMNSTPLKPKEIKAENLLGRNIKKEMMEAK